MILKQARYTLEHKALPLFYFRDKNAFMLSLLESKGELLYDVMNDFCDKMECENTYKKEDYKVEALNVNEEVKIVRVTMPDPRIELECKYVYFMFDLEFEKMNYFTVEKASRGTAFLCGWDEHKNHLNYGFCSEDLDEQLQKIIEIYMG